MTGELYRLLQPAKTLEALDGYEGEHHYRRELHPATLENEEDGRVFRSLGLHVPVCSLVQMTVVLASGEW